MYTSLNEMHWLRITNSMEMVKNLRSTVHFTEQMFMLRMNSMEMIKNLRSTVHITEQDVLGMHQEFYGNSLESEKHYTSLNKMYFLCIKNSM